jgi:transforming growth factor-beta-induced protein
MILSKSTLVVALVGLFSIFMQPAWAQHECTGAKAAAAAPKAINDKDIVEVAVASGKFNTLVAAVKAAGLVDALKAQGPLTVFAPTDEAFAKLPKGTVESLLKPENKAKLVAILTYHVASGKLMAADVTKATGVMSLQGQRLAFKVAGDAVMVDGATVVMADVMAKNGVIHAIDQVVIPTDKNVVEVATGAGKFATLLAAATAAGLADTLANGGPFTVFAPTDEAFAKLAKGTVEELLKPENKDKLVAILTLHVVSGRVDSTGAAAARQAKSLQGGSLEFTAKDGGLMVNGAKIVAADVNASNGLILVIDTVILPR